MISSIVDYIPISFIDFIYHFMFLIIPKNIKCLDDKKNRLYGNSCRSLFYTFLDEFTSNSKIKRPNVLVTPIHHTSFRNIIEQFFDADQITVLPMNDEYNRIIVTDDILLSNKNYDLCIVSHLFGQDLDTTELYKIDSKHRCTFLEDRVQGGEYESIFSCELFNYSLYSCGMDKKPCALGGGILYSRPNNINVMAFMNKLNTKISNYKSESLTDRYIFLLKKIPTYILYNCRILIRLILYMFYLMNINLYEFICYYRKKNPGFMHDGFNINPHQSTLQSIEYSTNNIKNIEKIQRTNSYFFMFKLEQQKINKKYFPWYRDIPLLTLYNTISVQDRTKFINFLNKKYVPVIDNPTYKLFTFDYKTKKHDETFNNSLVYIPTLYNTPFYEISELINLIETYDKL